MFDSRRRRSWKTLTDRIKQRGDSFACLRRHRDAIERINPEHLLNLFRDLIGTSAGKIDLVQNRHDLQILLNRKIGIHHRLRFNTLGSIHDQQRTFTRFERTRNLIPEVHMTRGVDEVEHVVFAVVLVHHRHGGRFDRDPTLPLQIHRIQMLRFRFALGNREGRLEQTVRERGLAVVDVGDDRKIAYMHGFGPFWLSRA